MVSIEEEASSSMKIGGSKSSNNKKTSSEQSRLMGRSMRTVRSNLYNHHPSPTKHTPSNTVSNIIINNNSNDSYHHQHQRYPSENLTDSVIDLRLHELASSPSPHNNPDHLQHHQQQHHHHLHHNEDDDGCGVPFPPHNYSDSLLSSSFLLRILQLEDEDEDGNLFSAYSSNSSCSDISGELHRLASSYYYYSSSYEEETCPGGFLEREEEEALSTTTMERISTEDLQPTVRLCVDSLMTSPSPSIKRSAAAKLRLLAKNSPDFRALIGRQSGAVPSLLLLLRSPHPLSQEHAVTALLNLSLHKDNRELMSDPVAVKSLIYVLKTGTETSKQNAACTLLNLSLTDEGTRMSIGACGAIPPLVSLLINGSTRGKKDALTTLYKLCGARVNKERAVSAGAVRPLVGMMMMAEQQQQKQGEGLAEKAMVVLSSLAGIGEGREAIVEEGGIAVLVEAIDEEDSKSHKVKEFAVMTLLQLCVGGDNNNNNNNNNNEEEEKKRKRNRGLLIREGGIPPLAALSQSGSLKAKHKAETLLRYLREPRQEASTSASPSKICTS